MLEIGNFCEITNGFHKGVFALNDFSRSSAILKNICEITNSLLLVWVGAVGGRLDTAVEAEFDVQLLRKYI